LPAESTNIGRITFRLPEIPPLPLCACCGNRETLQNTDAFVPIAGYKPGLAIRYSLCAVCHRTHRTNGCMFSLACLLGSFVAIGLVVGLFWKAPFAQREPFWTIGGCLVTGLLVGILAHVPFRRKSPGPPHTDCTDSLKGMAIQRGADGAFGFSISSGTLTVKVTCTHREYGRLLQNHLKQLGLGR